MDSHLRRITEIEIADVHGGDFRNSRPRIVEHLEENPVPVTYPRGGYSCVQQSLDFFSGQVIDRATIEGLPRYCQDASNRR